MSNKNDNIKNPREKRQQHKKNTYNDTGDKKISHIVKEEWHTKCRHKNNKDKGKNRHKENMIKEKGKGKAT